MIPLLIAGAAMSAAGTGMQMAGANKSRQAMKNTLRMYREKIRPLQDKSFNAVMSGSEQFRAPNFMNAYDQAGQFRQGMYNRYNSMPTGYGMTASPLDRGATQMAGQQRAGLMAQGDAAFGQRLNLGEVQRRLSHWDAIARGYLGEMPFDMAKAQQSGAALQGAGGLVSGLGGIGMQATGSFKKAKN
jgi:hypothetical protein